MKLYIAIFLSVIVLGCERKSSQPNVELIQDMMKDPSFKAQDFDNDKQDKRANLVPPEGTVPQGWTPYPDFKTDEEAKNFPNPTTLNADILARGEKNYQIYCGVCHNSNGNGLGTVAERMLVKPPSLLSDKIKGWSDGQLFHLITKGRGMMSGYESQIPSSEDRWSVVHYIRHLQKNQKADNGAANGANN